MSDGKLIDIAGHEIEVGDWVVYPSQSGRSVQMMLGTVAAINIDEKPSGSFIRNVQVQRLGGSRWSRNAESFKETRYRDKRTGKDIKIWSGDYRHWDEKPGYFYTHKETGEVLHQDEFEERFPLSYNWYGGYSYSPDARTAAMQAKRAEWVGQRREGKLKDYVEEYKKDTPPVTIQNITNIIKVEINDAS